ncbi:predicted protein [Nematostella vectensis]|uniref:TAFII55 protein conserved region domain-containing protein n=1 Tax=Nematostella vectensis TaxID=45351 RepID=A7SLJ3_NEMVE|nr:predicted protein [Nematostella vectensis]|eukprot:XP_001627504.1 predicted protein [Nematostella vectensis]
MSKIRSYDSGELENQFVLRLPKKQADAVKKYVSGGSIKEKLSIEFQADYRHATVRVGDEALSAKLVDLPCVMETHKTFDDKSFYKTADICQMLLCTDEDQDSQSEDEDQRHHKRESKKFVWNHGITPPLKNVRKRRFRKIAKKKVSESPEIEKEVKRLLRTDLSAAKVTFEVINDEEKPDDSKKNLPTDADLASASGVSPRVLSKGGPQIDNNSDDEDDDRNQLLAILQEASSDEDDDEPDISQKDDDDMSSRPS